MPAGAEPEAQLAMQVHHGAKGSFNRRVQRSWIEVFPLTHSQPSPGVLLVMWSRKPLLVFIVKLCPTNARSFLLAASCISRLRLRGPSRMRNAESGHKSQGPHPLLHNNDGCSDGLFFVLMHLFFPSSVVFAAEKKSKLVFEFVFFGAPLTERLDLSPASPSLLPLQYFSCWCVISHRLRYSSSSRL